MRGASIDLSSKLIYLVDGKWFQHGLNAHLSQGSTVSRRYTRGEGEILRKGWEEGIRANNVCTLKHLCSSPVWSLKSWVWVLLLFSTGLLPEYTALQLQFCHYCRTQSTSRKSASVPLTLLGRRELSTAQNSISTCLSPPDSNPS